jgi:hypothetical protein
MMNCIGFFRQDTLSTISRFLAIGWQPPSWSTPRTAAVTQQKQHQLCPLFAAEAFCYPPPPSQKQRFPVN